jgi:hypothetical protein
VYRNAPAFVNLEHGHQWVTQALGDQQYGNYNGLSPQRAVISENVRSMVLSSGAGDLGTASTSNLGGTIETYSSDPLAERNVSLQQTVGSQNISRTFVRVDTGRFDNGASAYASVLHHQAKAWDFDGKAGRRPGQRHAVGPRVHAPCTARSAVLRDCQPQVSAQQAGQARQPAPDAACGAGRDPAQRRHPATGRNDGFVNLAAFESVPVAATGLAIAALDAAAASPACAA